MKTELILTLDDPAATLEQAGGKGASLARMARAGFPVPGGFHITTHAYRLFVEANQILPHIVSLTEGLEDSDPGRIFEVSGEIMSHFDGATIPDQVAQAVLAAYRELPGSTPAVAVRSSATAEDLPEASFAGQQSSFLNVSTESGLMDAVRKCWASLWTPRAISYRMRQDISPRDVSLAVVVQLLIPADAAGIMFTANPVNGHRDQILINASWGLGEAVVGGLVTPDTVTVEKSSGRILSYETADKHIQTIRVEGGTQEVPVPDQMRRKQVLDKSQVKELGKLGEDIEAFYQGPMDIEWASGGGKIAILQARPITTLPDQDTEIGDDWQLPEGAYAAMRNNIVELMADPLTPLFKTLGLDAVNRSMSKLLTGFLGSQDVMPGQLIIPVNEYAYYNGSVKFGPILRIVLDTPGIMKRMFRGAVERWTEVGRPQYMQTVDHWSETEWKEKSSAELLSAVGQLTEAAIDAYGSMVSGLLPAAWISEAWFSFIYRLVKSKEDPSAPTFLMGFDSLPINGEKSLFDLASWAGESETLSRYLVETPAAEIAADLEADQAPAAVKAADWLEWKARFQEYLHQFGHMIYNLDFGNPVPADDPAPVIEALKLFVSGEGTDPYLRQAASAERREKAVEVITARLKGTRLRLFRVNLERAQRYAPLREDGLADVGLGYPLVRRMLAELGRRFTSAGLIAHADDIYWLQKDEVMSAAASLDQDESPGDLSAMVPKRKAIWESAASVAPPLMLPQLKVFGFDLLSLKAGKTKVGDVTSLKGVGASPGRITAPASVLQGPEDFSKMETGNVLVASMTTPAWTPLFARAGAVVTDIGGPLSHGSIVAREYGIPAVLGTDSATKNIKDGQTITVDGTLGIVTLEVSG